jgi:hypothetical protein
MEITSHIQTKNRISATSALSLTLIQVQITAASSGAYGQSDQTQIHPTGH